MCGSSTNTESDEGRYILILSAAYGVGSLSLSLDTAQWSHYGQHAEQEEAEADCLPTMGPQTVVMAVLKQYT